MRKQREVGSKKNNMTGNHSVNAFDSEGKYKLRKDVSRVLFLPDIHVPVHDEQCINAVLRYAETVEWDLCVMLGDYQDFDFISRFSQDSLRKLEGKRFVKEYEAGNKLLDRIQSSVRKKNPQADIAILEGNHDFRVSAVLDRNPGYEGLIEMERNLHFEERNILWWKYWTHKVPLQIGKLLAIHGEYIGIHHAKKHCDDFGRSVVYGHTHTSQLHTKQTFGKEPIQCFSIGTLSQKELDYMGAKPSAWINAFGQAFIQADGNFNFYTTNILNGSFIGIDGKVYKG